MRSVLEEVITGLTSALDVPVSATLAASRPSECLVVVPTGGQSDMDALKPSYALSAYCETYAKAESLIRDACDAAEALGMTIASDPVPLGFDGKSYQWRASYTAHALR